VKANYHYRPFGEVIRNPAQWRTVGLTLFGGLALLIWSQWELSARRWSPLFHQPIPLSRLQTNADFRCAPGTYDIVVELPMSARQKASTGPVLGVAPISCMLYVTVREGDDTIFRSNIDSLAWIGIVGSSQMNTFKAGAVEISKSGLYVLEMKTGADQNLLRGGSLSLLRDENSENAAVVGGVARLLGYALVGLSIAGIIFKVFQTFART